ncbi:hypothetical protein HBB16_13705 [Pseudonocardia sp. MCCB 268]|nr:hypothetical protein [Pseudonocardia cytotoxica]
MGAGAGGGAGEDGAEAASSRLRPWRCGTARTAERTSVAVTVAMTHGCPGRDNPAGGAGVSDRGRRARAGETHGQPRHRPAMDRTPPDEADSTGIAAVPDGSCGGSDAELRATVRVARGGDRCFEQAGRPARPGPPTWRVRGRA